MNLKRRIDNIHGRLAAGAIVLCLLSFCRKAPPPTPPARETAPAGPGLVAALLKVAPSALPDVVRDRYRVGPDRRLLAAVGNVYSLSKGQASAPAVTVTHAGDQWQVSAGNERVGVLPEVPTFAEGTNLLAELSRRLGATTAGAGGAASEQPAAFAHAVQSLDPVSMLDALGSLNAAFAKSPNDADVVGAAAGGFIWLTALVVDAMEQGDALAGRAWALLAREKALGADASEHEALLASVLGYEAAAVRAAQPLAADQPVRLYVNGDAARLESVCAGRPEDDRCGFLALRLVAEGGDAERFWRQLKQSPFGQRRTYAALALAARKSDFDQGEEPGRRLAEWALHTAYPPSLVQSVPSTIGGRPPKVESQTKLFEERVRSFAAEHPGALVDAASVEGFWRASFYSGLYYQANFVSDRLSSGPATAEFAERLSDPAEGTATELRRWVEIRSRTVAGDTDMAPLVEAIRTMRCVGAPPLERLRYSIERYAQSTDPMRRKAIPALFERLDSRPAHLVAAASAARGNLTSPALYEWYARAAVAAAPHRSEALPAAVALLDDNASLLRAVADDRLMPEYTRRWAIRRLFKLGPVDRTFARQRYEALVQADPSAVYGLVDDLVDSGELDAALVAIRDHLRRRGRVEDPAWANLVSKQARILALQGKLEAAASALKPALEIYTELALETGAWLELRRGRWAEGLRLARADVERYPLSTEASALIVTALWRLGDNAGAAAELAANKNGLVTDWTARVPAAFVEVFATAPATKVVEAFTELERTKIAPHILAQVATALGKQGDLPLALRLLSELHDPLPEWNAQMQIATWDLVRERSGAEAALAFAKQTWPRPNYGLALSLFQMRKYELLWSVFPTGAGGEKPRVTRLVKAAALVHLKEVASPRRAALVAELEADPQPDDDFVRGALFLLGNRGPEAVLRPISSPIDLVAVGWLMGLRAAGDGRFRDAESWFQVALESQQKQQPPHAWSFVIVSDWLTEIRSMELLQREGKF